MSTTIIRKTSRQGSKRTPLTRRERALVGVELATGAMALVGGGLLVARPDGSMLQAKLSALAGSPFADYRVPGVLLAALVGGGFIGTGIWQATRSPFARELSIVAGAGIVVFEGAELMWLGFQPLEAVFAAVGVTVLALAVGLPGGDPGRASGQPADAAIRHRHP